MPTIETCISPELSHLYHFDDKIVVIVDIFRATSTMMAALANGVDYITPIKDLEICRSKKSQGFIIAGERNGIKAKGFDLGNSPLAYIKGKYSGKKVAMTTTNGTLAIEKTAKKAYQIVLGAFVNLRATSDYLKKMNKDVLIMCAGWKGRFNLEDSLYAGALASLLLSEFETNCDSSIAMKNLFEANRNNLELLINQASHSKRLQNQGIEQDIKFCLDFDTYDILGVLENDKLKAVKKDAYFQNDI